MSDIVKVNFHGDTLDCVQDGDTVLVSIRKVCDGLGVSTQGQLDKLKNKPWAVIKMSFMTGPDGKNYETSCISLDSLPMWLATIEPSRVRPDLRAKLEAYQRECAKVLRDHFFGVSAELAPVAISQAIEAGITAALQAVMQPFQALQAQCNEIKNMIENRPLSDNCIGNRGARLVSSVLNSYASAMGGEDKKAVRRYRGSVEMSVRTALHFTGAGSSWDAFPSARWPELKAKLDEATRTASINDRRQTILDLLPRGEQAHA